VLCLHGAEDSMPGYDHVVETPADADVPLVVKSTGDAYAYDDTTVDDQTRETVYEPARRRDRERRELSPLRRRRDRDDSREYDDPGRAPTEGAYHPDHPGASYEELLGTFDPEAPTVAIWSTSPTGRTRTRATSTRKCAPSSRRRERLARLLQPSDRHGRTGGRGWVTDEWLTDADGNPVVDAVLSSFMFSLSMDERGRSANDEGDGAQEVFLDRLSVPVLRR